MGIVSRKKECRKKECLNTSGSNDATTENEPSYRPFGRSISSIVLDHGKFKCKNFFNQL